MPPKYKKGSTEMKNYMAKLRSMKGTTKTKKIKGEGILGDAWDYVKNREHVAIIISLRWDPKANA